MDWIKVLALLALVVGPTLALLGFVRWQGKKSAGPKKEEHRDSD